MRDEFFIAGPDLVQQRFSRLGFPELSYDGYSKLRAHPKIAEFLYHLGTLWSGVTHSGLECYVTWTRREVELFCVALLDCGSNSVTFEDGSTIKSLLPLALQFPTSRASTMLLIKRAVAIVSTWQAFDIHQPALQQLVAYSAYWTPWDNAPLEPLVGDAKPEWLSSRSSSKPRKSEERPCRGACKDYPMYKTRG